MAKQTLTRWLQTHVIQVSRLHFLYTGVYLSAIITYDAWNLITPDSIVTRWMTGAGMLAATAVVWYAARTPSKSAMYYQSLLYAFIAVDLFVATYSVYSQRGIASKAVLLYVIPILVASTLLSRVAIFSTAIISIALYSAACVRYFYLNPGQAYKVELYGEMLFYGAVLLVISGLVWALMAASSK